MTRVFFQLLHTHALLIINELNDTIDYYYVFKLQIIIIIIKQSEMIVKMMM